MSLIKWSPDPFEEMEQVLEEFSRRPQQGSGSRRFTPAVDVYEEEENIIVEAPLAGIDPSNVNVSIDNGVLSIEGESKKEHEVDDEDYYRKEVRSGSFFRQLSLPTQVNEDEISAEFEDGVLTITCPKEERTGGTEIRVEAK